MVHFDHVQIFFVGMSAHMLSTCVASALNWGTRVTLQDWALWVSHRPAFDVLAVNHGVVRCRSGWRGIDEGAEGCRRHCEMRKKS